MGRKKEWVKCTCEACGKDFAVTPCQSKGRKYCTRACQASVATGVGNGNWKGGLVKRNCQECGVEFERKQKDIKNGHGKFCSHKCLGAENGRRTAARCLANRIEKKCTVCGKSMLIKPSHAEKEGKHCSIECRSITFTISMRGENNPNYKGPDRAGLTFNRNIRIKAKAIQDHSPAEWAELKKLYGNKCACCKRGKLKLTKDHIVPVTKGGHNGISNIQPLCQKCNAKKFTKTITYTHQLSLVV